MELILDDIEVVYRRRGVTTHAVRGVSLCVRKGETLAIVGESGSGKTTVAKVAAGLQKPTSGAVTWYGERSGYGSRDRRPPPRRVQMVFQHPMQSLDPLWKIRRSVKEPVRRSGMPDERAQVLVTELIGQVGLEPSVLERYPRELSGGQAQRVAIARALVSGPEIVVLDEPTASLDQTVRARVLTRLSELQKMTGIGYLVITHDISTVRRLATRIAVMYRGLIVESGPATEILENARHPYTRGLIESVPIADPRVPWKAPRRPAHGSDGTFPDAACPVSGSPCARHGAGLHQIGPEHLVACTAR